jgi:hypothetical protein
MSRMLTFSSTSALFGVISIRGEGATTAVALGGTDVGVTICASFVGVGDTTGVADVTVAARAVCALVGEAVGAPVNPVPPNNAIEEPRIEKKIDLTIVTTFRTNVRSFGITIVARMRRGLVSDVPKLHNFDEGQDPMLLPG